MHSIIGKPFNRTGVEIIARLAVVGVISFTVIAGCHGSTSPDLRSFEALRIELTPSRLASGDTLRIVFRNMGSADVYANPCGSRLEREVSNSEWRDVVLPPGPNCGDTYRVIQPGSEFISIVGPTPPLQPGTYRYRVATIGRPSLTGVPEIFRFAVTSESFVIE